MEFLQQLNSWHWFSFAMILIILEMLTPGAFFLWMGVGAGFIALLLVVAPDTTWEMQLLLFSVFSVASISFWRVYLAKNPTETADPTLNKRANQYIGRLFTLEEPIVNERGRVRVDDSTWTVTGKDCPAQTKVRVVGVDGVMLKVEAVHANSD